MSKKAKVAPKEKTAPQLFSVYSKTIERVRRLSKDLTEETQKAVSLGNELERRFGIRIGVAKAKRPVGAVKTRPVVVPVEGAAANDEAPEEKSEEELAAAVRGYTPPDQMHADAPRVESKGSQEVAEIRAGAGLNIEAEDSESLANEGLGRMAALHATMKGKPTVIAVPGERQQGAAPTERSNAEGGTVIQKPLEDKS